MRLFKIGLLALAITGLLCACDPEPIVQVTTNTTGYINTPNLHTVIGKPTISEALVNKVLCRALSPACGTGNALYDLGVKYGIDPVYALAFFQHESTFGRYGVARTNLGLGNIRCTPGYSCLGGFRAYQQWQEGYEDWDKLILYGYVLGQVSSLCPCKTIEQIIPVYAPQTDHNDEQAYVSAVETSVDTWRQESRN